MCETHQRHIVYCYLCRMIRLYINFQISNFNFQFLSSNKKFWRHFIVDVCWDAHAVDFVEV